MFGQPWYFYRRYYIEIYPGPFSFKSRRLLRRRSDMAAIGICRQTKPDRPQVFPYKRTMRRRAIRLVTRWAHPTHLYDTDTQRNGYTSSPEGFKAGWWRHTTTSIDISFHCFSINNQRLPCRTEKCEMPSDGAMISLVRKKKKELKVGRWRKEAEKTKNNRQSLGSHGIDISQFYI